MAFAVDTAGGAMAAFAAALMTAALIFSWHYFEAVRTYFHALMLLFLAGMTGFCLTGDLFNQFVFFELMSVAAYALTGYKSEEIDALEGAINFAVVNSVGAFLVLSGIALLYGRTGALNLAQVGAALSHGSGGLLVPAALTLIFSGFFVKAAVAPFHFWLADAHAVAPTPVCVLFSGVMIELGLFGVLRIYTALFRGVPGVPEARLREVLMALGILTAVTGAVLCFAQRHFKRLLAYSSVSHVGVMLLGGATLTAKGVAGAALYLFGHGMVKGALFMGAGMMLHRFGSVDEFELHGKGRRFPVLGLACVLAALGLAGFPPFGTYVGKQMMEEAAAAQNRPWMSGVFLFCSIMTSGAVLRTVGIIFLGPGPPGQPETSSPTSAETRETNVGRRRIPLVMSVMAVVLTLLPIGLGSLGPSLAEHAEAAAGPLLDRQVYAAAVITGLKPAPRQHAEPVRLTVKALALSVTAITGAVALALLALFQNRLPRPFRSAHRRWLVPVTAFLRRLHSGHVGDYVTWVMVGVAVFSLWFCRP